MAVETALVAKFSGSDDKVGNGFGVAFLFIFVTLYATCVDPISYVYCSEIFPTHLRARGLALSVIGLFVMNLSMSSQANQSGRWAIDHILIIVFTVYTQVAPTAFAQVGWRFYLVFVILPLVGAPVLVYFMPETKGLSLEEIGEIFGDRRASAEDYVDKAQALANEPSETYVHANKA